MQDVYEEQSLPFESSVYLQTFSHGLRCPRSQVCLENVRGKRPAKPLFHCVCTSKTTPYLGNQPLVMSQNAPMPVVMASRLLETLPNLWKVQLKSQFEEGKPVGLSLSCERLTVTAAKLYNLRPFRLNWNRSTGLSLSAFTSENKSGSFFATLP